MWLSPGKPFGVSKAMYSMSPSSLAFFNSASSPLRSYAPRSPPRCLIVVSKRLALVSVVFAQSSSAATCAAR